jgi:hypothetical protein
MSLDFPDQKDVGDPDGRSHGVLGELNGVEEIVANSFPMA